jgi:hypothetical protein
VTIGQLNLTANGSRSTTIGSGAGIDPDQAGNVGIDVIGSVANIGGATLSTNGETARDLAALGLTSPSVSATGGTNLIRAENGALNFTLANNGFGSLVADLAGDLEFAAVGSGTIRAESQIDARVSGLLSFTHANAGEGAVAVAAPNMFFTSSRIEVGGLVGNADTDFLVLFADEQDGIPAVIGGDTEEEGYTLTQAEAARLQADFISVDVDRISDDANFTGPNVIVRDLTLQGTANGEGTGEFSLSSDGDIRVEGQVDVVNAAASDVLALSAERRIDVITPTGGIRMTGLNEEPSGILLLEASQIYVTDAALNQQLVANPDFEGRVQALRTNNGPVNQAGYLQAGAIFIEADGGEENAASQGRIYIQNTGTATEFAGLTTGAGGLTIEAEDFSEDQ